MEEWGSEEEGWRERKRHMCRYCDVIKNEPHFMQTCNVGNLLTCEIYRTCRGLSEKKVVFHAKATSALTCIAIESRDFGESFRI
jgi:hypothetical protein